MAAPEDWSSAFHTWLNDTVPSFSEAKPVLVEFSIQLLRFPLNCDDPVFVATFGRLFRFREDVRRLAAGVLYSMSIKYNLDLNFSQPGIQEGKFYGAHLRTAKDAVAVGWPGYQKQAANYLGASVANNLSLIYLTTGNPEDAIRFRESARSLSIAVATKDDLLSGNGFEDEFREMESLSWDQKGLFDYEVLLRE